MVLCRAEVDAVRRARENAGVMLNRYLKLKLGPKKAETKVRHHDMNSIKLFMESFMESSINDVCCALSKASVTGYRLS